MIIKTYNEAVFHYLNTEEDKRCMYFFLHFCSKGIIEVSSLPHCIIAKLLVVTHMLREGESLEHILIGRYYKFSNAFSSHIMFMYSYQQSL